MSNLFKYILLPLILLAVAIYAVFWVILPLWGDTASARDLLAQNQDNLKQREELAANLARLISQYNERSVDLSSFGKAIPTGQSTAELLVNLEAIASANSMNFAGVDFKPYDLKNPKLKAVEMDIKLKGSYPNFQNYLKAMETSLRLFDVLSVSFNGIKPGETSVQQDKLDFNLTVIAYYQ